MSSPTVASKACERYQRLRAAEPESTPSTPADQQLLREHPDVCEHCGVFESVLSTARWNGDDVPCEPLDMLTRRRLINDAVAAAADDVDATPRGETPPPRSLPEPAARRPRRHLAYAAAVSALLIAGALLWSPWQRDTSTPLALTGSATPPRPTRYLLLAGQVRTDAGSAVLGQGLRAGQWLETGPGARAVLRLPTGATVLLGPKARLRLLSPTSRSVELQRGTLLALVDPQRRESRFSVVTRQGTVQVKGTVFEVTANRQETRAAVLRGRVMVIGKGSPPVALQAGHQLALGHTHPQPLTAPQSRLLWQRVKLLDLLQMERPATLVVTSHPVGARVSVDGVALGTTPLAVALRPGHRRLELAAKDHASVREHVLLEALARTTRDFELRPGADPSAAPARPGPHSPPRVDPRRPHPRANMGSNRPSTPARDLRRSLLNRAQLLRTARDWRNADRAYRELIRRYPTSAEATTALVSVGVLQLRHLGQPARALRSFERYLRRSRRGPLAREAAYGRILALRALGRRSQEQSALRRFLKDYPKALRATRVKRRLHHLTQGAGAKTPGMSRP